jgi:hypothetical protein
MTGRFRFTVAGLLFAAGMINYMDRAALGVVAPIVSKELSLSPSQLGVVFRASFSGTPSSRLSVALWPIVLVPRACFHGRWGYGPFFAD